MKTNKEIKKGLDICFNGGSCEACPYNDGETPEAVCDDHLGRDALELIEQQEQKIEELTAEIEALKADNKKPPTIYVKVEEYCQNCPDFHGEINKHFYNNCVNTTIYCTHAVKCRQMYERIKKDFERDAQK